MHLHNKDINTAVLRCYRLELLFFIILRGANIKCGERLKMQRDELLSLSTHREHVVHTFFIINIY